MGRLEDRIAADLSDEQRIVVSHRGKGVVIACPGSGKTKTAAYYVAKLLSEWAEPGSGLAILSFTNNAVAEIEAQLSDLGVPIPLWEPHFLGTIDSFLTQYLFRPYAHLVMGCQCVPQVVPPTHDSILNDFLPKAAKQIQLGRGIAPRIVQLADVDFRPNGELDVDSLFADVPPWSRRQFPLDALLEAKLSYARAGLATHSDIVYWCFKLAMNPGFAEIRGAIQSRYRSWVVDEAQDTSELHELLLHAFWNMHGNQNLLVIGDPDQSIFEWNKAKPDYLLRLRSKRDENWQYLTLVENWRSSQLICNAAHPFRNPRINECPAVAKGPDAGVSSTPLLLTFPANSYYLLIQAFLQLWGAESYNAVDKPSLAMVAWRRDTVGKILGRQHDIPTTMVGRQLASCVSLYLQGDRGKAYEVLDNTMCALLFGRPSVGDEHEWLPQGISRALWSESISLLLPALVDIAADGVSVAQFIAGAREVLSGFFGRIGQQPAGRLSSSLKVRSADDAAAPLSDFIDASAQPSLVRVTTIHSLKGSTVDGLMLVGGYDEVSGRSDVPEWLAAPNRVTGLCKEPRRLAYVAMTRPRKFLAVALPTETGASAIRHSDWVLGGFRHVDIHELGLSELGARQKP